MHDGTHDLQGYASGRFFESVEEDVRTTPLPEPLAVIGGVGSEIRSFPEGVNKGTAAAFIARELGFERDHVIVAGNSGNDVKLVEHDFYASVVSNAHGELKQYANLHRVYLSPHARAEGVRDGLQHWIGKLMDEP